MKLITSFISVLLVGSVALAQSELVKDENKELKITSGSLINQSPVALKDLTNSRNFNLSLRGSALTGRIDANGRSAQDTLVSKYGLAITYLPKGSYEVNGWSYTAGFIDYNNLTKAVRLEATYNIDIQDNYYSMIGVQVQKLMASKIKSDFEEIDFEAKPGVGLTMGFGATLNYNMNAEIRAMFINHDSYLGEFGNRALLKTSGLEFNLGYSF